MKINHRGKEKKIKKNILTQLSTGKLIWVFLVMTYFFLFSGDSLKNILYLAHNLLIGLESGTRVYKQILLAYWHTTFSSINK